MKLIQLNVWGGKLDKQISSFFKEQTPDILCLQEAISINAGDTGLFLPLEEMQAAANLPYLTVAPAFSFNYMRRTAHFGNAIVSRYPILKSEVIFTNLSHTDDFDFDIHKSANMRNFIHSVVEYKAKPLNVLTHHGYHIPDHKNGDKHTLQQMKQLADYTAGLKGPVILTGDFNLAPHSESLELINQKLDNLSILSKLKTTRTSLTHKTEVCDYIFVNDSVKVKEFSAAEEIVSDHQALLLDFEI